MTLQQLQTDIQNMGLGICVSKWLMERTPHIFNGNHQAFLEWKQLLSERIGVDSNSIIFVGSSCVGFSLNPHKKFKLFDEDSDIDIAIVSHHYFNIAWHQIRQLKPYDYPLSLTRSLLEHRDRLIFWGTIATDKILSLLPFGEEWNSVIEELSAIPPIDGKTIKFRLYQDHESLRAYHLNNIKQLSGDLAGVPAESIQVR